MASTREEGLAFDRIWDVVFGIAEDEDTRGKISYIDGDPTGSATITVGGTRYRVTIEKAGRPND